MTIVARAEALTIAVVPQEARAHLVVPTAPLHVATAIRAPAVRVTRVLAVMATRVLAVRVTVVRAGMGTGAVSTLRVRERGAHPIARRAVFGRVARTVRTVRVMTTRPSPTMSPARSWTVLPAVSSRRSVRKTPNASLSTS